jgi:hypothetical protein
MERIHASNVSEWALDSRRWRGLGHACLRRETAMRNIVYSTRRRGNAKNGCSSLAHAMFILRDRCTPAKQQDAVLAASSHIGSQQTPLTHHLTDMSNTSGSHCWSQRQCSSSRLCQAARCRHRWADTGCNPGIELSIRHRHTHFEQRTARSSRRRCQWLYRTFR